MNKLRDETYTEFRVEVNVRKYGWATHTKGPRHMQREIGREVNGSSEWKRHGMERDGGGAEVKTQSGEEEAWGSVGKGL